jgi:hypothetical protein
LLLWSKGDLAKWFETVRQLQHFLDKRPSGPALLKKQRVLGLPVLQGTNESTSSQNAKAVGQQLGGSLPLTPSSLNSTYNRLGTTRKHREQDSTDCSRAENTTKTKRY